MMKAIVPLSAALVSIGASGLAHAVDIVHDGEYYFLKAQHGEAWAAEDKIGYSLIIANPAGLTTDGTDLMYLQDSIREK
ncbi:MAG: hypothetical protein ACYTFW_13725 [Planctomycetota bacterium]|jgi:hypothetical protein